MYVVATKIMDNECIVRMWSTPNEFQEEKEKVK